MQRLQLGDFELTVLSDGNYELWRSPEIEAAGERAA